MQNYKNLKTGLLKNKKVETYYIDMEPEFALISQVIEARINRGITQKELAEQVGTRQSAISRFESGSYNPSLEFIIKISKALDTKLCILLK
jgi:DNA-binding XRE family transcriptional regulator